MRISNLLFLAYSLTSIWACESKRNEPFDIEIWNQYTEFNGFEHRESMIKSLANQHLHLGMSKGDIIGLLGEPATRSTIVKNEELAYLLTEDYGSDIDPVEVSYFILKFESDSTLESIWKRTWKQSSGSTEERYKLPF